jgi:hypothetical protein
MDVDTDRPMQEDSLFIMMSSTKPLLGVATMMMIEEGLIRLEDPVSKYISGFAGMQVAVLKDAIDESISPYSVNSENIPEHRLVPAQREITIHDLLTHTSGLASGGLGTATSERPQRDGDSTLASIIPQYGSYALDFQPGARWPMKNSNRLPADPCETSNTALGIFVKTSCIAIIDWTCHILTSILLIRNLPTREQNEKNSSVVTISYLFGQSPSSSKPY